jgi:hypothetical protein
LFSLQSFFTMRIIFKLTTIHVLLFVLSASATAQNEKIIITNSYDARLKISERKVIPPVLPQPDTATVEQMYAINPPLKGVAYDAPKFRPLSLKTANPEKAYSGLAKLGGGVPTSLLGEIGYGSKVNEQLEGKVWYRHHAQNADKLLANQRFFQHEGQIAANYFINEQLALDGKIGYTYNRVHFYGYNHDSLTFTADRVRQDYKIFDLETRIYNKEHTDADFNYSVSPKLYLMNDFYSNKESGLEVGLSASKWFNETHPLRLNIRADLTRFKDTVVQNLNNIYLQPSFTFHGERFKLKIGGNFVSNNDAFSLFPDMELGLRIFGDGIQVFAGATGDLRKNTYRNIAAYNPFIDIRASRLRNTHVSQFYGGVKGDLGWLDYSGQIGYSRASDLALYQTLHTTEGITRFGVIYDTVDVVNVQGTVKLQPAPNVVIRGTLSQNITMLTTLEEKPWGLPTLEGNFTGLYTLLEGKASLKANCYVADGIWFKNTEGSAERGKVLFDFGFGGTYRIGDHIGAFLDINNLLNNRRARWANYPMIGTNLLIGITARF